MKTYKATGETVKTLIGKTVLGYYKIPDGMVKSRRYTILDYDPKTKIIKVEHMGENSCVLLGSFSLFSVYDEEEDHFDPPKFSIHVGDFKFDFFLTNEGKLGLTVEKSDPEDDNFTDIIIDKDLNVESN